MRQCLELGGYTTVADLQDARAKLASAPYLKGEVEQRAAIWVQQSQDRPGEWAGFADGRVELAASYAERIMLPMTVAEASAIAPRRTCYAPTIQSRLAAR